MPVEIKNAVIKSTQITNDDHGLLTIWLHLDYGSSGQGFGGYNLYCPRPNNPTKQKNYAGHFIWRVMETVGVTEWTKLAGRTIRVKTDHTKVHAIGNIIKDQWFDPGAELKEMEEH